MTLATRCPRCATVFRLVPEQLLLAAGWARCGCCHTAFDAAAARVEWVDPSAAPAAPATADPAPAPALTADPDEPRFVRQARAAERWSGRRARMGLALLASALALLLAAQMAITWRGAIVARWPASRAALQQLCRPLHCQVLPAPRPDLLELDGSALSPAGDMGLLLQTHVRNRGAVAVAWPALELTLTGAPSQVLVRRVILPQDYLGLTADQLPGALQRGLAAKAEQDIRLPLRTLGVDASGYTLTAFDP